MNGKPYKTVRRHLTGHGLTPDQYRWRYGVNGDSPAKDKQCREADAAHFICKTARQILKKMAGRLKSWRPARRHALTI